MRIRRRYSDTRRVREASEFMEPDEIAEHLHMPVVEVLAILGAAPSRRVPCVVIDAKTRRVTHHLSFRAAYRHVCIAGLTAWSWHTKAAYEAWCEVNGVTP